MKILFLRLYASMCIALLAFSSLNAQQKNTATLTGSVIDSATAKSLPYASISLLKKDSFYIGTTADANGKFELNAPAGKYTLQVSELGYIKRNLPLSIEKNTPLIIPPIQLTKTSNTLETVTVTQLKALVEDKGDRLVYNAEKDISNSSGTAADVLRKVPMLTVDLNGNLQMRGSSNLRILINGKPSAMMARNLAEALKQMPANIIKSVEVITSPGAKYDAEGAAGVINIITKKGLQGLNGSVNASAGNYSLGAGTTLSYHKKKIGISLSANMYRNRYISESSTLRTALNNNQPLNTTDQQMRMDNTGTGGYGEMSVDYDPDTLTRINFAANIWGGVFPNNSTLYTRVTDPAENVLQEYKSLSKFKNPFGNGQLDLGYTKTFRKPGREFSFLTQFSRMPDNYFYTTQFYTASDDLYITHLSENYSRNKEYTVQTDYTHPFTLTGKKDTADLKIEAGAKMIYRDIGSEYYLKYLIDSSGAVEPDPSQTNVFDYTQKVLSGYTSLHLDTRKKWGVVAGLRLERTILDGNFRSTATVVNSSFNNLLPSITLSKGFRLHRIKISYTQRIQRPLIWLLNPWRNQNDPKNIWTGNPFLLPEINHSWEVSHSVTGNNAFSLNTAFFYRHTNKGFEFLSAVDSNGVSVVQPQNIGKRYDLGTNINASVQPNKNWNLSSGVELTYVDMKTINTTLKNSGWVWRVNYNTGYKLPKNYSVQADGNFGSGWISLQGKNSGWYWYGFSGKKEIWDKKASLTLNISNPFQKEIVFRSELADPFFRQSSLYRSLNRSVRLTFEWRFGQLTTTGGKQSKKITNDDKGGK